MGQKQGDNRLQIGLNAAATTNINGARPGARRLVVCCLHPVQGARSVLAWHLCHACSHSFLCIYPEWLSIRMGGLLGRCQAVPVLQLIEAGCTKRGSRNLLGAALLCWGRPTYREGSRVALDCLSTLEAQAASRWACGSVRQPVDIRIQTASGQAGLSQHQAAS